MSSKFPVAYVDIRVSSHATEDEEKVLKAVRNALPEERLEAIVFKKANLTGHHGNPITLFEARIKEKEAAQAVFAKLSSSLNTLDKESLSREVAQHFEKGNLYIRLDKQSAFLGEFRLSTTDPIHFKIHFKKHSLEDIVEICRQFGLLP